MALLEDVFKGNMVVALATGAAAIVLPTVFPYLSPQLRSAVRGGLSLLLEAEHEAEGGIIDRLAETALKDVLERLSEPGSNQDRQEAAEAVVEEFKHRAHRRARRYGREEADRKARYRRHVAVLHRKLARARTHHAGPNTGALEAASERLHVDEGEGTHGTSG